MSDMQSLIVSRVWGTPAAPVIGLAPGQAVAGLEVDGLILLLVAVSRLRSGAVR